MVARRLWLETSQERGCVVLDQPQQARISSRVQSIQQRLLSVRAAAGLRDIAARRRLSVSSSWLLGFCGVEHFGWLHAGFGFHDMQIEFVPAAFDEEVIRAKHLAGTICLL